MISLSQSDCWQLAGCWRLTGLSYHGGSILRHEPLYGLHISSFPYPVMHILCMLSQWFQKQPQSAQLYLSGAGRGHAMGPYHVCCDIVGYLLSVCILGRWLVCDIENMSYSYTDSASVPCNTAAWSGIYFWEYVQLLHGGSWIYVDRHLPTCISNNVEGKANTWSEWSNQCYAMLSFNYIRISLLACLCLPVCLHK